MFIFGTKGHITTQKKYFTSIFYRNHHIKFIRLEKIYPYFPHLGRRPIVSIRWPPFSMNDPPLYRMFIEHAMTLYF